MLKEKSLIFLHYSKQSDNPLLWNILPLILFLKVMGVPCFASVNVPEDVDIGMCSFLELDAIKWADAIAGYDFANAKADSKKRDMFSIKSIVDKVSAIYSAWLETENEKTIFCIECKGEFYTRLRNYSTLIYLSHCFIIRTIMLIAGIFDISLPYTVLFIITLALALLFSQMVYYLVTNKNVRALKILY